jgi:hypothetical protein
MKASSADGQSEPKETPWPSVPKISGDEFHQSFAVAQLALKLWQASKTSNMKSIEKAVPKDFLADAWELIKSASEQVLRPQTVAEYLVAHGGSHEAAETALARILSAPSVPFERLCNPERHKGDTESIKLLDAETGKTIEVEWKVYRGEGGERAFDNLFWNYWRDVGEKWKRGDQEIGTVQKLDTQGKPRRVNCYPEFERTELAKLARNTDAWKERGRSLLDSWKENGVPPPDFLALAKFRRERDNRAKNLKETPKRKRWQQRKAR